MGGHPKLAQRVMQTGLDGARPSSGPGGDLVDRQVEVEAQDNDLAVVRAELA